MRISIIEGNKGKFVPTEIKDLKELSNVITLNGYSLGTFNNNHRSNEDFQGSHFLGLDFDGGMTLNEAKLLFADYTHIIATTRSHQIVKSGKPPCDRFRVILKAKEYIDNQYDYTATIIKLMEKYPAADKGCKDAARFFFESKSIISFNDSGKLIDVVKYVKPETPKIEISNNLKGLISNSTLKFIAFGAEPGTWNSSLFKAAKDLYEQQYTKEEAINLLTKATLNYDGELDSKDLRTIEQAFSKEPEHAPRGSEFLLDLKHPLNLSTEGSTISWVVDGLYQAGAISMLAGSPKSGKSTLTRQLAMSVARGGKFLGRDTVKGSVIYLALEENESMISEQFKKLGIVQEDPILLKVGPINNENPHQLLKRSIEASNAKLVVIDTLLLMTRINDINSYNESYKCLSPYRDIARETGVHIAMIHHKNKGQSTRSDSAAGSTGLAAAVDCTVILNETNNPEYRFLNSSQRGGIPFTNQKIKYIKELDIYEISNDIYVGDF